MTLKVEPHCPSCALNTRFADFLAHSIAAGIAAGCEPIEATMITVTRFVRAAAIHPEWAQAFLQTVGDGMDTDVARELRAVQHLISEVWVEVVS